MTRLSHLSPIYLKLSGFLTELTTSPLSSPETFALILPYFKAALDCFGARRIMFGSDWPVCGVGARAAGTSGGAGSVAEVGGVCGAGEEEGEGASGVRAANNSADGTNPSAWSEWYQIVSRLLDELGIDEEEREWIWWRTSMEAYGLDVDV